MRVKKHVAPPTTFVTLKHKKSRSIERLIFFIQRNKQQTVMLVHRELDLL